MDQTLLLQHLPRDYAKIQNALDNKAWQSLRDANHALLGALLYCDIPPLKALCIAVKNADDFVLADRAQRLLNAMLDLIQLC